MTKMFPIEFRSVLFTLALIWSLAASGQVTVTGALSGNGTYPTLRQAFAAINLAGQNNATILVTITASTDEGSTPAILNNGSWTSLTITPAAGPVTVAGAASNNPVIDLNGADNVVINGLLNLTIMNTATGAGGELSAIRLRNGANLNVIRDCIIKAAPSSTTTGIIKFSGSTTSLGGNKNNSIIGCTITPDTGSNACRGIFSDGTTGAANTGNIVTNCLIADYFSASNSSFGIVLVSDNGNWVISNNKFYQSQPKIFAANNISAAGIKIDDTVGSGYTIQNNIIGYGNSSNEGITEYSGTTVFTVRGIDIRCNNTNGDLIIKDNIITNFNVSCATDSNIVPFIGIAVTDAFTAQIKSNVIGSQSGAHSITVTTASGSSRTCNIRGISCSTVSDKVVDDNFISNIKLTSVNDSNLQIYGIEILGTGNCTVSDNTVGNDSAGIHCGTSLNVSGTCEVTGIISSGTVTKRDFLYNSFKNINIFGNKNLFRGIFNRSGKEITIRNNVIGSCTLTGTGSFNGILNDNNATDKTSLEIDNNTISLISLKSADFVGIDNTQHVLDRISISNNQLGVSGSYLVRYENIAAANNITGIRASGNNNSLCASLLIENNIITGILTPLSSFSQNHNYIVNNLRSSNSVIRGNEFKGITNSANGNVSFISIGKGLPANSTEVVENNRVVNGYSKTGTGSVYFYIATNAGQSGAQAQHRTNEIRGISVNSVSEFIAWYFTSDGNIRKVIENNIIQDITMTATAALEGIRVSGAGSGSRVEGNTINNINFKSAFTGVNLTNVGSSANILVKSNTISNISQTEGGSEVVGIRSAINSNVVTIQGNIIQQLSSSGPSSSLQGIKIQGGTGTITVINSVIRNFFHYGNSAPKINGIIVTAGNLVNLSCNKIHDLNLSNANTGGALMGIQFSASSNSTLNVYNNLIGKLDAAQTSNATALYGIACLGSNFDASMNLYHNTVLLSSQANASTFGSAGVYHASSPIASRGNLRMNNNIIINISGFSGSGVSAAIRRSSTGLTNFNSASNNNLFYAGNPGPKNLIYFVGSTVADQTIAAYKARLVTSEQNSLTENVVFSSTDGYEDAFLHIADGTASLAQGNASLLASVPNDYDNQERDVSFPDIGADEFNGAIPVISQENATLCTNLSGQQLIITGSNLHLVKQILFPTSSGGVVVNPTAANSTSLSFNTPGSITSGAIQLSYGGGILNLPLTIVSTGNTGNISLAGNSCSSLPIQLVYNGNFGTIEKWQYSNTPTFSGLIFDINDTNTTITVNSEGDERYFRVVISSPCGTSYSSVFSLTNNYTTWNGTAWTAGYPQSGIGAIVNANLNIIDDFTACTLWIKNGANVQVMADVTVHISGQVKVESGASLTFENTANLLQDSEAVNFGVIKFKRSTVPLFRLDYTMWCSPVAGEQTLQQFSPQTSANRFYNYDTTNDQYFSVSGTSLFELGKGYLIRMPNNWISYNLTNPQPSPWTGIFSGTPNNGTVTLNLASGGNRFNAVGNIYPSPISISDFISLNSNNIEGTVWLWRKTNDGNDPVSYSTCTSVGCTNTDQFTPYQDDRYLSKGQGFIVKLKQSSNTIAYNNSIRRDSNLNQFFRSTSQNRYWINLKSSSNKLLNQLLIAYNLNGTDNYDEGMDGLYIDDSNSFLGTVVQGHELSVEAKPEFEINNRVNLSFRTSIEGNFSISIYDTDGIFESGVPIILLDKYLNVSHILNSGAYNFTSSAGSFNDRFEIVYQESVLSNETRAFTPTLITNCSLDGLKIQCSTLISEINVFDIQGRRLVSHTLNSNEIEVKDLPKNQPLLLVVKLANGATLKEKIICGN